MLASDAVLGPPEVVSSPKSVLDGETSSFRECTPSQAAGCEGSYRVRGRDFALALLLHAASEPFDERKCGIHLQSLWRTVFPSAAFERKSDKWLALGFQAEDPVRDLRGVGALGLRHLHHFCHSSGATILRDVSRSLPSPNRFPLATASLNVTHLLCSHLGLLESSSGGVAAVAPCTEATFELILSLQHSLPLTQAVRSSDTAFDVSILDLMHEQLLCWLHQRWERLDVTAAGSVAACKLMQFPSLLSALAVHLQETLAALHRKAQRTCSSGTLRDLLLALRRDASASLSDCPGLDEASMTPTCSGVTPPTTAVFARGVAWLLFPAVSIVAHTCPPPEHWERPTPRMGCVR